LRKIFVSLLLCGFSVAMYGQKTRYGQDLPLAKVGVDYPIQTHISGIHYRGEGGSDNFEQVIYADAIINGKKVELRGGQGASRASFKLLPGDYSARLLKDPNKIASTSISQEYEFVLPDRTVWRCTVTGVSE
jgi:hypothetical protein